VSPPPRHGALDLVDAVEVHAGKFRGVYGLSKHLVNQVSGRKWREVIRRASARRLPRAKRVASETPIRRAIRIMEAKRTAPGQPSHTGTLTPSVSSPASQLE
jgi:hypothetical protein